MNKQSFILESEFEKKVHQLEIVEKKVADLMEVISKTLNLLPLDLEGQAEGMIASSNSNQIQLDSHLEEFGRLINSIQSELRQHFIFMGENSIVSDLDLPIRVHRGPMQCDSYVWKSIMKSLDQQLKY